MSWMILKLNETMKQSYSTLDMETATI